MQKEEFKSKIDELVNETIESLKKELSYCIESIVLTGSYTIGKMALERPNVNFLIFVKSNVSADDYLKIGEIFYRTAKKYKEYFGIRIDSLPFRFGIPIGKKEYQLILTPNVVSIATKDQNPPFGIPKNVLEGMMATRKVVFGGDSLAEIDTTYTKEDLLQWAFFDVGILFRNLLMRAPLSYDVEENLDLLAHESLELGKVALYWGTEIFMTEEDIKQKKYIELIKDKRAMLDFYQNLDSEFGKSAKIILEARESFNSYKTDKDKVFQLYDAAYAVLNKVFSKILMEMKTIKSN